MTADKENSERLFDPANFHELEPLQVTLGDNGRGTWVVTTKYCYTNGVCNRQVTYNIEVINPCRDIQAGWLGEPFITGNFDVDYNEIAESGGTWYNMTHNLTMSLGTYQTQFLAENG